MSNLTTSNLIYSLRGAIKNVKDGASQKTILNIPSLDIYQRDFCGIRGESGAGKSTLLNILGGIDKITSGKIEFCQDDISENNAKEMAVLRRNIGFVFQSFQLINHLNVWENVAVPLMLQGKDSKEQMFDKVVQALLEARLIKVTPEQTLSSDSKKKLYQSPKTLSGGEQQRVAIARAIVSNPIVILADEPTGNLDSNNEGYILDLLEYIHQELSIPIILVSHSDQVIRRCSRVITVNDGTIVDDRYYQ